MPIYYSNAAAAHPTTLKTRFEKAVRRHPASRAVLHAAFILVAFSAAVAGGYILSTPAAGFSLNTATINELPVQVALWNCAVFLLIWAWLSKKTLHQLNSFCRKVKIDSF